MPIILKSGETRYTTEEVKQSGKPYWGKNKAFNGAQQVEGYLSWAECRKKGIRLPTTEEDPVQYRFISNPGCNYYLGLYDRRKEYQEWKVWWEEKNFWEEVEDSMKRIAKENARCHVQKSEFDFYWCKKFFPEDIITATFHGSAEEFYEYDKAVHFFIKDFKPVGLDYWSYDEEKREASFQLFKQAGRIVRYIQTRVQGSEAAQHVTGSLKYEQELTCCLLDGHVQIVAEIDGQESTLGTLPEPASAVVAPILESGQKVIGQVLTVITERAGDRSQGKESVKEWNDVKIQLFFVEEAK